MELEGLKPRRELLTAGEVARLFGVDHRTVNKWAKSGALPAIKPGGHWRFRAEEVQARRDETEATR